VSVVEVSVAGPQEKIPRLSPKSRERK